MAKNLLIVESPAKAKTIEKILGSDFKVTSCYGHIRDLSRGDGAIDVSNDYEPNYIVPDEKKKVVKELKDAMKANDEVWLATDEDREGEAISWHLCEVLGLKVDETKRIVFHEITKPALQKAVQNPRSVNLDLVNAQQARRVLDRLVGFALSPILWRKIVRSNTLSAGRVQSVAVRIVVEAERAIEAFETQSFYKIASTFNVKNKEGNNAKLKAELANRVEAEGDAAAFVNDCINAKFTIANLEMKPAKKKPRPPFTTSTLQQEASYKLGFSVSRTMSTAQKLYEAGFITYMRTDSVNLSETARQQAADVITNNYGKKYSFVRQFKTKSKDAQEAHEAIRPTYFDKENAGSTPEEEKLYKLIWQRAISSQMAEAELERTTAKINVSTRSEQLVAKGEVLIFDGFLKVYRSSEEDKEGDMLPPLSVGQVLDFNNMTATQRFTRPPARYTEASLVKKLEELGIGRPSTYAPTIATIQKRNYVVKEKREGKERAYKVISLENGQVANSEETERTGGGNKLYPTDMGIIVNDFLVEHFKGVLNYDFTAKIEDDFDKIAQGEVKWNEMIDTFYKPFKERVDHTMETAERVTGERVLGVDPETGRQVCARLGRFGPMIQIGTKDEEEKPLFAKIRPPYSLGNINFEQAMEMFNLPRLVGEFEGKEVKASEGRFGPYIMHDGNFASIPKKDVEYDVFSINIEQAIELIHEKRRKDAEKLVKRFDESEDIYITMGKWKRAYIKQGKANIPLPKEKYSREEAAKLTYDEVLEIIENVNAKKKAEKAKKKAERDKAKAEKKAAAEKKKADKEK